MVGLSEAKKALQEAVVWPLVFPQLFLGKATKHTVTVIIQNTLKVVKMAGRLRWRAAKMAVFFKSPNLFFIIYIKLSCKFDKVLTCMAAKMAGKSV